MADPTFIGVTTQVQDRIDTIATLGESWVNTTLTQMEALATQADALLDILSNETYVPTFDSLNLTYSGPTTPVEPTEPVTEAPTDPTLNTLESVTAFSWSETPYTELMKAKTKAALDAVFDGSLVISAAIWDAMWNRVATSLVEQQVGEEWAASNLGASLGWDLPSETTLARLDVAQDETSKRLSVQRLEKVIQEAVQRREDLWNSVTKGTTFEQIWQQHHSATENRALEGAIAVVQQAIAINTQLLAQDNVEIQLYLAKWEGLNKKYLTVAALYQARISAAGLTITSEEARRGFESLKLDKGFKTEDGVTNLAIQTARLTVEQAIGVLSKLADLAAGMAQAALSASDVSLGTGTHYQYSEYNDINA